MAKATRKTAATRKKAGSTGMVGSVVMLTDGAEGKKGTIAREVPSGRIDAMILAGLARRATIKDFQIAGVVKG